MPDPNVEDSQVVDPGYDLPISSPLDEAGMFSHRAVHLFESDPIHDNLYVPDAANSGLHQESVVEETQYEPLEPDTQAPDSLLAQALETQRVNLEKDTQAQETLETQMPDTQIDPQQADTRNLEEIEEIEDRFSPRTRQLLQADKVVPPVQTLPSISANTDGPFFSRPNIQAPNPPEYFRFNKKASPVKYNFNHDRNSGNNTASHTGSAALSQEAIPQAITQEQANQPINTGNSIGSLPSVRAPNTLLVTEPSSRTVPLLIPSTTHGPHDSSMSARNTLQQPTSDGQTKISDTTSNVYPTTKSETVRVNDGRGHTTKHVLQESTSPTHRSASEAAPSAMQHHNHGQKSNVDTTSKYDSGPQTVQSDSRRSDVVLNIPSGSVRKRTAIVDRDSEATPQPSEISGVQSRNPMLAPKDPETSRAAVPAAILSAFPTNVASDRDEVETRKDQTAIMSDLRRHELQETSLATHSVAPVLNVRFTTQPHVQTEVQSNFPLQGAVSIETPKKKPRNPSSYPIPNDRTPLARKPSNFNFRPRQEIPNTRHQMRPIYQQDKGAKRMRAKNLNRPFPDVIPNASRGDLQTMDHGRVNESNFQPPFHPENNDPKVQRAEESIAMGHPTMDISDQAPKHPQVQEPATTCGPSVREEPEVEDINLQARTLQEQKNENHFRLQSGNTLPAGAPGGPLALALLGGRQLHQHVQESELERGMLLPSRASLPLLTQSRASSLVPESSPRPYSQQSNIGVAVRPAYQNSEAQPQSNSQQLFSDVIRATKVQKSKHSPALANNPIVSDSLAKHLAVERHRPTGSEVERFENCLKEMQHFKSKHQDCQAKLQLVEHQGNEINSLKVSNEESKNKLTALLAEKEELMKEVEKSKVRSTRFREKFNEVVNMQRGLKAEGKNIRDAADAAKMSLYNERARDISRVKAQIRELKEEQEQEHRSLMSKNAILVVATKQAENELKESKKAVQKANKELQEHIKSKEEFERELKHTLSHNSLLQESLNKNLMELGRETKRREDLDKQLTAQLEVHKGLVETLKKVPAEVFSKFTCENGVFEAILASGTTTQSKLDEVSSLVTEVKNFEAQPSPSLVKLIEDIFSGNMTSTESLAEEETSRKEFVTKSFDDLKAYIKKFCVDIETNDNLRNQITELREAKAVLNTRNSSLEIEVQNLTTQQANVQRDLSHYQEQLASKAQELQVQLNAPKEDPRLVARIQELETTNSGIRDQLRAMVQEVTSTKEDLTSAEELSSSHAEEIRHLESKCRIAQSKVERVDKIKQELEMKYKGEVEKQKDECAKTLNTTLSDMKLKHDATLRNLRQKCTEREAELKATKEALEKVRNEKSSTTKELEKEASELATCKKQIAQLEIRIEGIPDHGTEFGTLKNQMASLGSPADGVEAKQLYSDLETARNEAEESIQAVLTSQAVLDASMRRHDALEMRNTQLQIQLDTTARERETMETQLNSERQASRSQLQQIDSQSKSRISMLEKEIESLKRQDAEREAKLARLDGLANLGKMPEQEQPKKQATNVTSVGLPTPAASTYPVEPLSSLQKYSILANASVPHPNARVRTARSVKVDVVPETQPSQVRFKDLDSQPRRSPRHEQTLQIDIGFDRTERGADIVNSKSKLKAGRRAKPKIAAVRERTRTNSDKMLLDQIDQVSQSTPRVSIAAAQEVSVPQHTTSRDRQDANFSKQIPSSSPLTDLEPLFSQTFSLDSNDHADNYGITQAGLYSPRMSSRADSYITNSHHNIEVSRSIPDSQPSYLGNTIPDSYKFSSPNTELRVAAQLSTTNRRDSSGRIPRHRQDSVLKPALKKSVLFESQSNPNLQQTTGEKAHKTSDPTNYQLNPSISQLQVKSRQPNVTTSSYKRVAEGHSIRASTSASTHVPSRAQPMRQNTTVSQKSPLPSVPSRNKGLKRKSSNLPELQGPPPKRRISLPRPGSNRVILDSQAGH
ncbi:hypothetical protein B0J14DRAFT_294611 [Halenospora varia]|nr:hypothetical protein B0J14DRAFT_294611 [Halenospora varia]